MPLESRPKRRYLAFVLIGLVAGFMSGLFGVGGGIVIVPLLLAFGGLERKLASGTSLAAIVPTSAVGVVAYAIPGHVDVVAALILAAGSVVGAQLGALLLARLPVSFVRILFMAFAIAVAVQLFLFVPERGDGIALTGWTIAGLVAVGLFTGVLAGIIGIGGGVVVVPALILLFSSSDLVAKGTSMLMMVPTAISGTIGNLVRKNVDLVAAAIVGVSACLTTALGATVAAILDPRAASVLFAIFLVAVLVKTGIEAWRDRPRKDSPTA
ncbi:sulfite exporter TauE/SafE family protein [Agrococcus sp. SGAir0287]|uniref:sulfite exporter TauE/SafE family protein n=1 Tax=Agrococcus sp. SGAir0287 TaxID=2070347 RepID=UPI0026D684CE